MYRLVAQLLLVLCLVLAGIGNAVAMVRMAPATAMTQQASVMSAPDTLLADVDCGHAPGSSDQAPPRAGHAAHADPATHGIDCDQGCCDLGSCKGACAHTAYATLVAVRQPPVVSFMPAGAAAPKPPHLTPALPEPIRPPIG